MSSKIKLKKSLRSINDAKSALQRALQSSDSNASICIRRAIGELEDAETGIKRAIRELPA
jgi:hypothetical protein